MTNALQEDAERLRANMSSWFKTDDARNEAISIDVAVELGEALQAAFNAGCDAMVKWQPLKTAPKDGTPILLLCGSGVPYVGLWLDGSKITEHGWYCFEKQPYRRLSGATYWMHLPDNLPRPEYGEKK